MCHHARRHTTARCPRAYVPRSTSRVPQPAARVLRDHPEPGGLTLSGRHLAVLLSVPALAGVGVGTAVASEALPPAGTPGADAPIGIAPPTTEPSAAEQSLRAQLKRERAAHSAQLRRVSGQLVRERRKNRRTVKKVLSSTGTANQSSHAIRLAAIAHGVSQSRLRSVAHCESTLNPNATNGRYVGLFQFGTPLWNQTPYRSFSRTDPYAASQAAAWAFARGMASHWSCA